MSEAKTKMFYFNNLETEVKYYCFVNVVKLRPVSKFLNKNGSNFFPAFFSLCWPCLFLETDRVSWRLKNGCSPKLFYTVDSMLLTSFFFILTEVRKDSDAGTKGLLLSSKRSGSLTGPS
jgi:hypothetical protein